MGIEYYIIKPKTKQKFYLGRRISCLEGLTTWSHTKEAKYPEWECWEDVVFDLQENSRYFLEGEQYRIGQIWDFCAAIYDFCDAPVYMDNDCNDENSNTWEDYEEIDVFSDILTTEEEWCELINLIPQDKWVTEGSVIYEFETVKRFLQELRDARQKEEEKSND